MTNQDNFTVTKTFKAKYKNPISLGKTGKQRFSVEQRYHGDQVITYRVKNTEQVFGSDLFWLNFAKVGK